jgi:hypothetical protein
MRYVTACRPPHHATNSALALIDYQPDKVSAVRSMDQDLLVKKIRSD